MTLVLLVGTWYLQDLMQVLVGAGLLAPELFFMALNGVGTKRFDVSCVWYLLPALGGLLLDFRWSGMPGLTAAVFVMAHWAFRLFWFDLPRDGRTGGAFVVSNWVLMSIISCIRLVLLPRSLGALNWLAVYLFQMVLTVPAFLAAWSYRTWNDEDL